MSEETITEFQIFWSTCFIPVFLKVYDGQKEERGSQSFWDTAQWFFLLNPVLLLVLRHSTSHY